jgi:Short C-terminal domain/Bacterial PH domain
MTFDELSKNGIYLGPGLLAPKKSLDYLQENLLPGETLLLATNAKGTNSFGALGVTNQRIIYAEKGMLGKTILDLSLKKIKTTALAKQTLLISDGGDTLEFKDMVIPYAEQLLKKIKEQQMLLESASTPAAQPAGGNSLADLEKLADLKAKGIITEEEFAAKKKALLGL